MSVQLLCAIIIQEFLIARAPVFLGNYENYNPFGYSSCRRTNRSIMSRMIISARGFHHRSLQLRGCFPRIGSSRRPRRHNVWRGLLLLPPGWIQHHRHSGYEFGCLKSAGSLFLSLCSTRTRSALRHRCCRASHRSIEPCERSLLCHGGQLRSSDVSCQGRVERGYIDCLRRLLAYLYYILVPYA